LQPSFQTTAEQITIGIDLGDRFSHCCVLGPDGKILTEGRLRSTPEAMARHFHDLPDSRIEVGTHSRWMSQLLGHWGHEVIVANPRNLRMIADSIRKADQVDAHMLARLARRSETALPYATLFYAGVPATGIFVHKSGVLSPMA